MVTVAAPVIVWEMQNWLALGGGNSGIVGDPNHDYGFHIGARYLPANDYSRRRDPNGADGPYVDWDYACAGDFSHKNNETLRAHHRRVLNGLMNGQYPMICEFIGKPWADKPVYYWARWNGIEVLQKYTGSGHDHWSHISWYRSKVDQKANLWTPEDDVTEEQFQAWLKKYLPEALQYAIPRVDVSLTSESDPTKPPGNPYWASKLMNENIATLRQIFMWSLGISADNTERPGSLGSEIVPIINDTKTIVQELAATGSSIDTAVILNKLDEVQALLTAVSINAQALTTRLSEAYSGTQQT